MQVALLLTALANALDVCVLFHLMVLFCTSVRGPLRERMLIESEQSTISTAKCRVQDSPLWTALSSVLERKTKALSLQSCEVTRGTPCFPRLCRPLQRQRKMQCAFAGTHECPARETLQTFLPEDCCAESCRVRVDVQKLEASA